MEFDNSSEEEKPQAVGTSALLEGARSNPSGWSMAGTDTTPEISIHALWGSPSPKKMRILGHIGGCAVVILVDTYITLWTLPFYLILTCIHNQQLILL